MQLALRSLPAPLTVRKFPEECVQAYNAAVSG